MEDLVGHMQKFGFYSNCDRKTLKSFKQRSDESFKQRVTCIFSKHH